MASGIKFRTNTKQSLIPNKVGEIVYSPETNEWGLCVDEENPHFIWRMHEAFEHILSGNGFPSPDIGIKSDYYIDNITNTVYQKSDVTWEEITFPVNEDYFNRFAEKPFNPNYGHAIKKDGSVLINRSRFTETSKTITPKNTDKIGISSDGVEKFKEHVVSDPNGIIFKNAEVQMQIPDDGNIGDLIWKDGKLQIKAPIKGHIRYYTDTDTQFNTGTFSPTNGYIDIISNEEIYPIDYASGIRGSIGIWKIEVIRFGDRTSWYRLAYDCYNLTEFIITATDECRVTNFSYAWNNCTSLTSFPQLDVSSGTNFNYAWHNCISLTSFPLLDTSNGTNFSYAWEYCSSLTSFPQLDVSSGTDFSNAWIGCSSLTSFPLIDTSSGTDFGDAWNRCSSLTSFPLLDTSKGTNFRGAWYKCFSLTPFPQLDVSSGTNFYGAWWNCDSLTSFPLIDTSKGTDFGSAWRYCRSLTSFPQLDVSSGTNFKNAWWYCTSLPHCPAGNEVTIPAGAVTTYMCEGI